MRDLFIILLALEGMLIGVALVVMIIQLASLINVLENEIKPLVSDAQETVNTMRGTAQFISRNVTEPVIKSSSFVAGTRTFVGSYMRELRQLRRATKPTNKPAQSEE